MCFQNRELRCYCYGAIGEVVPSVPYRDRIVIILSSHRVLYDYENTGNCSSLKNLVLVY